MAGCHILHGVIDLNFRFVVSSFHHHPHGRGIRPAQRQALRRRRRQHRGPRQAPRHELRRQKVPGGVGRGRHRRGVGQRTDQGLQMLDEGVTIFGL